MSLSKVYKHSPSFVPKQLLPQQEHPSQPGRRDINGAPSANGSHHESFVADSPYAGKKESGPSPVPPEQPAEKEPPPLKEEPPAPAIDLELIQQQAYSEGVLAGRRQTEDDFGTCALTLRSACNQLATLHETILRNNLEEMHNLVMLIAEKVIRHSITEQSDTILATIEDAIRLAVKSEEFQIRVHPDDLEIVRQKKKEIIDDISGLDNIVLKADNSVDRGGCILESANCTVDATIGGQLQIINESLVSSHEAGAATAAGPEES